MWKKLELQADRAVLVSDRGGCVCVGVGIYEGEKEEVMDVGDYKGYSVLMSVYHKEKPEYLKQAIASIQAQTLPQMICASV